MGWSQAGRKGPRPACHTDRRSDLGTYGLVCTADSGEGAVDCSGKRVWVYVGRRIAEGASYRLGRASGGLTSTVLLHLQINKRAEIR